jgi:hypothetical protein
MVHIASQSDERFKIKVSKRMVYGNLALPSKKQWPAKTYGQQKPMGK